MPKTSGFPAAPESAPDPSTPELNPGRLTVAHVLPATAFPVIGGWLHVAGMPISEVFTFLAGCGGIGAAVTITVTGGRRALIAMARGVLAATGSK
jgi:hypothetical protein